ncbi:fimbrillin family protein [Bacteroides clarus]|uniref:fimbrillin family protein n=1 Tax=Bacteroides clarus TaxID=626929 RepID=UPI0039790422
MSISSCYVVKNDNSQSENFASPIGLYLLSEDNQPYDNASYKNSASLVGEQWKIAIPVYVEKPGKVYAYYPYQSGDDPEALVVNMANQVDLLYSKTVANISPGSSSLSVKLHHALSQITVAVENEEVAGLSLLSPMTGKFNVCVGSFTQLTSGVVNVSSGNLLIVPHVPAVDAEMTICLKNGSCYQYSLAGMDLKPGETYVFKFKLNANRETLEIASFSVQDWVVRENHVDYLR